MSQRFELAFTATGEVRDGDGNLISSEPLSAVFEVTEEELRALNLQAEEDKP